MLATRIDRELETTDSTRYIAKELTDIANAYIRIVVRPHIDHLLEGVNRTSVVAELYLCITQYAIVCSSIWIELDCSLYQYLSTSEVMTTQLYL